MDMEQFHFFRGEEDEGLPKEVLDQLPEELKDIMGLGEEGLKNENSPWKNFDELPEEVKEKIEDYCQVEEIDLDEKKFHVETIKLTNNIICLPFTEFDMRGDGETNPWTDELINLKKIQVTTIYATGAFVCEKINKKKKAYVIYSLDDDIAIIEID